MSNMCFSNLSGYTLWSCCNIIHEIGSCHFDMTHFFRPKVCHLHFWSNNSALFEHWNWKSSFKHRGWYVFARRKGVKNFLHLFFKLCQIGVQWRRMKNDVKCTRRKENQCVYGYIFLALKTSMSISSDSENIFLQLSKLLSVILKFHTFSRHNLLCTYVKFELKKYKFCV
jgi:hypothetical protein